MHTPGAQVLKVVHTAAKMCTQGAGCALNFEHCHRSLTLSNFRDGIAESLECSAVWSDEKDAHVI